MAGKVRHLVLKDGRYYWQPASALRSAGWRPVRLPEDALAAAAKAEELNAEVDAWRRGEAPAHAPKPAAPKVVPPKPVGRRPRGGRSGLYAVRAEGADAVKIGIASDPTQRLVALQTGSPQVLRLVFFAELPFDLAARAEAAAHEAFRPFQTRSEWFAVPEGVALEQVLATVIQTCRAQTKAEPMSEVGSL